MREKKQTNQFITNDANSKFIEERQHFGRYFIPD